MLQFTYTPAVAMRSRPDRRKGDPAMDGAKLERGGPEPIRQLAESCEA